MSSFLRNWVVNFASVCVVLLVGGVGILAVMSFVQFVSNLAEAGNMFGLLVILVLMMLSATFYTTMSDRKLGNTKEETQ